MNANILKIVLPEDEDASAAEKLALCLEKTWLGHVDVRRFVDMCVPCIRH